VQTAVPFAVEIYAAAAWRMPADSCWTGIEGTHHGAFAKYMARNPQNQDGLGCVLSDGTLLAIEDEQREVNTFVREIFDAAHRVWLLVGMVLPEKHGLERHEKNHVKQWLVNLDHTTIMADLSSRTHLLEGHSPAHLGFTAMIAQHLSSPEKVKQILEEEFRKAEEEFTSQFTKSRKKELQEKTRIVKVGAMANEAIKKTLPERERILERNKKKGEELVKAGAKFKKAAEKTRCKYCVENSKCWIGITVGGVLAVGVLLAVVFVATQ